MTSVTRTPAARAWASMRALRIGPAARPCLAHSARKGQHRDPAALAVLPGETVGTLGAAFDEHGDRDASEVGCESLPVGKVPTAADDDSQARHAR